MRTTLSLDDDLVAQARAYTGLTRTPELVRSALVALIQREAAGRLPRLGGSDPTFESAPRRRADALAGEDGMAFDVRLLDPRLPGWGFPAWGSAGAAGLDLHACLDETLTLLPAAPAVLVSSGLAVRIGRPGWCGLVVPRSGAGHRGLVLGNTVGVIDADYEGPILLSAWNRNAGPDAAPIVIAPGERIAQLVFVPVARPTFRIVSAFDDASARGEGGFGSTGAAPAPPVALP